MATRSPIGEEAAGAAPIPLVESRGIRIIFAAERCFEVIELDAIRLFCITLCLRNFADHARMHGAHLLGRLVGYTVNRYISGYLMTPEDGVRGFAVCISISMSC